MNIIDPKQVQEALLRHRSIIAKPRAPMSLSEINTLLQAQVLKLKVIVQNLDGSELETLKHELQILYVLMVRLQVALDEAHNPELANIFVIRQLEQNDLSVREIRSILPGVLENVKNALNKKDLLRVWAGMGGILGGVKARV